MNTIVHARFGMFLLLGLLFACGGAPAGPTAPTRSASIPFQLDFSKEIFTGTVTERVAAGPYTYLSVRPETGAARWAVVLGDGPPAGRRVVVTVYGTQQDFVSARLDRTFSTLAFSRVQDAPSPSQGE